MYIVIPYSYTYAYIYDKEREVIYYAFCKYLRNIEGIWNDYILST